MAKTSVHIKIGFLMAIAVSFLLATGYLAYRNLSAVVASIPMDIESEMMLMDIRRVSMDLEQAESSIRLYLITGDTSDLRPYYNFLSTFEGKMSSLRTQLSRDPELLSNADTISKLIGDNIIIWNEILVLNRDNPVVRNLRQMTDSLVVDTLEQAGKERGLLGRVFGRKNQDVDHPDRQALIENLQEIEAQEGITRRKMMAREYELAVTSTRIRERFYEMIGRLESRISETISQKASEAGVLAGNTYRWLALFSVSGTLLGILVLFIVVRYVRKTLATQNALELSRKRAENLARTKELFMANMSHEIRTPVTAISGFAEQLQRESHDAKTGRIVNIIKSSSDHLSRVIEDILDFSRLEQSRLTLDQAHFRVRQLMEEVYGMFEYKAALNNTDLTYTLNRNTPEVLLGDPYRLKQILINLVSNAVKFTPEGTVHFGIRTLQGKQADMELIVEVTDTGIGIDQSKIQSIFEDFTQEENSITRRYGGTGLGLSIVKKLVVLHGGTIEVKSRKNHGTRFTCRLPYSKGDPEMVEEEERFMSGPAIRGSGKLKVLVVDDEEYNRLLFKTILERMNVEYHEAADGAEALALLRLKKFDMMFMDVRMPGLDGLEVTRIIREKMDIGMSEMPIICISAASVKEQWPDYDRAGMNAFLPKPFTEKALQDIITAVFRNTSPSGETEDHFVVEDTGLKASDKLNLQSLYHIAGGDEQFVVQMLTTYMDTTHEGLNSIARSVTEGNSENVAHVAHKILPPSRHLGASSLCRLLEQIEVNIKTGVDIKAVGSLTDQAFMEFEKISRLLNEHIAEHG